MSSSTTKAAILALCTCVIALASCGMVQLPPQPFEPPVDGTSADYLVYFQGRLVGWERRATVQRQDHGRTIWNKLTHSFAQFSRDAGLPPVTTELWVDADYDLAWMELRRTIVIGDGVRSRQVDIQWNDSATIEDSQAAANERVKTFDPRLDNTLTEEQAEKQLLNGEIGKTATVRRLSYERGFVRTSTWTFLGEFTATTHDGQPIRGKAIRKGGGATAALSLYDNDDWMLYTRFSDGFVLERVASIPDPFVPEPLNSASVVATDVLIQEPAKLEWMEVEVRLPARNKPAQAMLIEESAYQRVKALPQACVLRLNATLSPGGQQSEDYPPGTLPDDFGRYLSPTVTFQSDDGDLKEAADQIVEDEKSSLRIVGKLCHFVHKRLSPGPTYEANASAKTAFVTGHGDCSEAAALLVTLARAVGLPARRVVGLLYTSNAGPRARAAFVLHAWAEVWVGTWVPADATLDVVGAAARYISLFYDATGSETGDPALLDLLAQPTPPLRIIAYGLSTGERWQQEGTVSHFK